MSLDNIEFHIPKQPEITSETRLAAQKTICCHAENIVEAELFMRMIGILPNREEI